MTDPVHATPAAEPSPWAGLSASEWVCLERHGDDDCECGYDKAKLKRKLAERGIYKGQPEPTAESAVETLSRIYMRDDDPYRTSFIESMTTLLATAKAEAVEATLNKVKAAWQASYDDSDFVYRLEGLADYKEKTHEA